MTIQICEIINAIVSLLATIIYRAQTQFERETISKTLSEAIKQLEPDQDIRRSLIEAIYPPGRDSSAYALTEDLCEQAKKWTIANIEETERKLKTIKEQIEWS